MSLEFVLLGRCQAPPLHPAMEKNNYTRNNYFYFLIVPHETNTTIFSRDAFARFLRRFTGGRSRKAHCLANTTYYISVGPPQFFLRCS